jgi:hypothetical protein
MAWTQYEEDTTARWKALLASDPAEDMVQEFLEWNPGLLPGVNEYNTGHHNPLGGVLYSQPRLQNLSKDRRPDFMWLGKTSDSLTPVLIEIEAPGRRWFTSKGRSTTHAFTHAHGQLAEWKAWFSHPENQTHFRERYYNWPTGIDHRLPLNPTFILIYGRRSEFDDADAELIRRRAALGREREILMTFDRLRLRNDLDDVVTVRLRSSGEMRVIGMPASYTTGPMTGETSLRTGPAPEVVARVSGWTAERRAWVKDRWAYWAEDEAARQRTPGPLSLMTGE